MRLTKRIKIGLLGLVVSLIAMGFIIQQVDLELFMQSLTRANYWYLIPCMVLLILGLVTRALRWQVLLSGKLPLVRAFSIMNVAYLVNGILPLRIGEVARVYLVSRTKAPLPVPHTTSSIIVERLLDLSAVVVMVLLALMLGPVPQSLQSAAGAGAAAVLVGLVTLVLLAGNRTFAQSLLGRVLQHIPVLRRFDVLEEWFEQFLDGLAPLTTARAFIGALAWTGLSWLLSIAAGYVLMFAFFDQASVAATMLYIAAAAFAIAVPAVPGNVGPYELSIMLALGAYGYDESSVALAFAVMVHGVNVFVHASTGVVGFVQEGVSWAQLSQGVQQMQQSTEVG